MSLLIVGLIQLFFAFAIRQAPNITVSERQMAAGAFALCSMMCFIATAFVSVFS